ncbi:hypothetical protein TOPH_07432 [Tolypocladium ophioglossoides CBS 100239]|uniref:Uncharacterized protein n=1 Tax=Tolypocladium ophioglossoides (strain CBS 100239) TaxID=1163406 RepID=A0A0L0N1H5_TOLOC|nr:hypothetical protein TOPH_07432 [Tolypocladium ophioglossoides CBS 100239]
MSDLKAATNIDPNVWYHLTEGRVDDHKKDKFGSMLQVVHDDFLAVWGTDVNQYWQFQPVDDKPGRFAVRCSSTSITKQLSVCWHRDEVDSDRTRPCMAASDGSDEQKWDVANWGNDMYRFVNVKNASSHHLDVHPGNPVVMSSNTNTKVYQAAQHWLMTSVKKVDDGAYSTVFSDVAVPTVTFAPRSKTIPSSDPSGTSSPDACTDGLSSGAKAGIGIGVALGVVALALATLFLWRRKRAARAYNLPSTPGKSPVPGYASSCPPTPQEMPHSPAPQEVSAPVPHELDSTPLHRHSR